MSFSPPSPTQTLQARPQQPGMPAGVTPELIQLLAQMKVKQATDAAARDLAMKQGQQPDTVAAGLQKELEGNATAEIMQKMAPQGLRALAPQAGAGQGQNMQAQQAQQMAAGQPQQMAQGGLVRLPSNLPRDYAGGGIVAFQHGGPAPKEGMAEWRKQRPGETDGDYALRMEAGPNFNESNPDSVGGTIANAAGDVAETIADLPWEAILRRVITGRKIPGESPQDAQTRALEEVNRPPAPPPPPKPERVYAQNDPRLIGAVPQEERGAPPAAAARPSAPAPYEDVPPDASWAGTRLDPKYEAATLRKWQDQAPRLYEAYVAKYPEVLTPATASGPGAPVVQQSQHPLADPLNKSLKTMLEADPRAQTRGDVDEIRKLRGLPDLLDQQRAIIEEQKARQAAAAQNRVPSWAMGAMGAQAGPRQNLGAFLASMGKGAVASDAAYAATDETNASKIDTLRTKMIEAQMAGNEKDAAGYQALLERNIMGQGNAQQSAASVLNTDANNRTRESVANQSHLDRVQRMNETHSLALERAKNQGRDDSSKLLLNYEAAADRQATLRAKAEADAAAKMGEPPVDVALRSKVIQAEILEASAPYQHELQKLGIAPAPAKEKAPSGAGWSAKLKG